MTSAVMSTSTFTVALASVNVTNPSTAGPGVQLPTRTAASAMPSVSAAPSPATNSGVGVVRDREHVVQSEEQAIGRSVAQIEPLDIGDPAVETGEVQIEVDQNGIVAARAVQPRAGAKQVVGIDREGVVAGAALIAVAAGAAVEQIAAAADHAQLVVAGPAEQLARAGPDDLSQQAVRARPAVQGIRACGRRSPRAPRPWR
jgi:hypothetical protein